MRTKWFVTLAVCLIMVGLVAAFAEAGGKPISSAPPFSSLPPDGQAVAAAGQAYGLCATGVATTLSSCVSQSGGNASAIASCVAAAATGGQACQETFFTTLSSQ
jgi:hypothetical protein